MSTAEAARAIDEINRAWLENRPEDLASLLDASVVMVLPGFAGRVAGRDALVAGFVDFCRNARMLEFQESDRQLDVIGSVAVASFSFVMVYERGGEKYRSTGRDLWVLEHRDGAWRAVWRTMLDLTEEPAA